MTANKEEYVQTVVKWIGKLIMIVSIFYLVKKLSIYKEDIQGNFRVSTVIWIAFFSILYSFLVYLLPFIYKTILYWVVKKKYGYRRIAYLYCKSNIYKYLPGNVMQYIGRNQLAIEDNIEHKKIFFATLLEISITVLSAILVSIVFAGKLMWTYIGSFVSTYWYVIVLGFGICAILLVNFVIKCVITNDDVVKYLGLILYNSLITIMDGILFWLLILLVNVHVGADNLTSIIGLFSLSFIIGFITPGVPGGIGIREAMLCMVLEGIVDSSTLVLCSIYFRIISVLGDLLAYLLSTILYKGTCDCGKSKTSNI